MPISIAGPIERQNGAIDRRIGDKVALVGRGRNAAESGSKNPGGGHPGRDR
jgi:hypothetical protein